jgi:phosphoesterase RecJ-like protein
VSLEQAVQWMKEKDDFLLTTHVNPDGDGLGAQSALYLALRKMGKKVRTLNRDPLPHCYRWLPYRDAVEVSDTIPPHQVCVTLDVGDLTRLHENVRRDEFKLILNIDHHFSNTRFGDLNWIDPDSPAAGEMVYRLIRALGIVVDRDIAESVYTSLVTDTGAFKYSNTTPQAHRLAAELMEAGAQASEICDRIFANVTRPALELLRLALVGLTTREGGRIGVLTLSQAEFKKSGAAEEDSENLVDFVRKMSGVEVAVFLKERIDGKFRLSLRSRNAVDVSAVAATFGGGGHKHSAGAILDGPAPEALERVLKVVTQSLR